MNKRAILVCGNDQGLGGGQVAFRRFIDFLDREQDVRIGAIPIGGPCPEDRLISVEAAALARLKLTGNPIHKGLSLCKSVSVARRFSPSLFITIGLSRSANAIMNSLKPSTTGIAFDFIADRDPTDPLLLRSLNIFGHICVQSPSMVTRLVTAGLPAERVSWGPCFSGPDFPELARSGLSKRNSVLRLGYFGRLASNKGLPIYLEALRNLDDISIKFDIWGTGPEEENIRHAIDSYGLSSLVTLCGHYPSGADAVRLMASYDAVVLPSQRLEGVPLVMVEAMAAGVPVLCTDIGAMRDPCVDNPDFFLSAPDASSLAETTRHLNEALAAGKIDHTRLRRLYDDRYSNAAVAEIWRKRLGLTMNRGEVAE